MTFYSASNGIDGSTQGYSSRRSKGRVDMSGDRHPRPQDRVDEAGWSTSCTACHWWQPVLVSDTVGTVFYVLIERRGSLQENCVESGLIVALS